MFYKNLLFFLFVSTSLCWLQCWEVFAFRNPVHSPPTKAESGFTLVIIYMNVIFATVILLIYELNKLHICKMETVFIRDSTKDEDNDQKSIYQPKNTPKPFPDGV
jgi:hypothetical protein